MMVFFYDKDYEERKGLMMCQNGWID